MGRKRINMELISNDNTRSSVYKARKTSLMKKALELTTLCDVKACMIIYGGDPSVSSNFQDQEPAEIWPPDPHQVNLVLSAYREKRRSERHGMMTKRSRMCDLSSFLEEKKKSMEEELEKSRKRNRQAKYPAWFDFLNDFSETELRDLAKRLEKKIEAAKSKVAMIKARRLVNNINVVGDERVSSEPPLFGNNVDNTTFDAQIGYYRHEPMMALMMRDDDYDQCNTCLTYENEPLVAPILTQGESYCYDGSIDIENMISGNPNPLPLLDYY